VPDTTPVLELEGLSKRYRADRPPIFENLSLRLAAGEYLAIMGESGVGKSTLLNLLAGLDRPDAGRVLLDGVPLSALDDDAATLAQNVALPLDLLGVGAEERRLRSLAMLAAVGIEALAAQLPRELSGGEVQRVAIARALVHAPRLVLADEPTGNLDPRSAAQTLALLREQIKSSAGAGLLITHSRAAAETADRILVLDARGLRALGSAAT
jgi:putative ABC transport system ATP-binding protein